MLGKFPDFWVSILGNFPDFWVLLFGQNGAPPLLWVEVTPPPELDILQLRSPAENVIRVIWANMPLSLETEQIDRYHSTTNQVIQNRL